MPIIENPAPIAGVYRGYQSAGAPSNGTDAVQTLTVGGTPTGGTFALSFGGFQTAAITWSATNNTLRDNVDAALEALPNIGTGGVTTAVGTMTAGVGTLTITFAGNNGRSPVSTIAVAANNLTGTAPTVAVATTTPGVLPSGNKGAPTGAQLTDTVNGKAYINTGTQAAPTWTVVGSQT
jgi:hypothetical protein